MKLLFESQCDRLWLYQFELLRFQKGSIMGQNFISDGAKFLILFFTSKIDGVYPGSHKNTIFSKKN